MPSALPTGGPEAALEVTAGQTFTITLAANPSTGYQWGLAEPLDEATVRLVGSEYLPPASSRPGAGGTEVWTFSGVRRGTARIVLGYARPWEHDLPSQETREYLVTVR